MTKTQSSNTKNPTNKTNTPNQKPSARVAKVNNSKYPNQFNFISI